MKVLDVGWGEPPSDLEVDVAVNTSRMLTRQACGEKHGYIYEDRRVPDRDASAALHLGITWHDALERLTMGDTPGEIIADYSDEQWVPDNKGKTEQEWFEAALVAYDDRYAPDWPGGTILDTEVPFWMHVWMGYEAAHVLVRGRIDRLSVWHDKLVNGEIKTQKAGSDLDIYMAHRSQHPQDALYYLAMVHGPKTLPNGATLPSEVYGTRYDITQKYSYPASKWKDAAQRRAEWRTKIFYGAGVPWRADRALAIANKAITDYLGLAGIRHRNLSACTQYGRCPFFDVCFRGLPLSSSQFKDRDPDYVDTAKEQA